MSQSDETGRCACETRVVTNRVDEERPGPLRVADSIGKWRLWVILPTAVALTFAPMPDWVRIALAVVLVPLLLGHFVLRVLGHFLWGYRGV